MNRVEGLDADAGGNIYVAGYLQGLPQLFKFAPDGSHIYSAPLAANEPGDIAIDEAGNRLIVADGGDAGHGIKIFDISGMAPSLLGSINTPADAHIVGIHYATQSGNILATDRGSLSDDPRGLEYSPTGSLLREYRPTNGHQARDILTIVPEPSGLFLLSMSVLIASLRRRQS